MVLETQIGQGSSSSRINDINVFINDQSIGIFELPVNIPIQQTGPVNLKIRAMVYKNGQSNEKVVYPFYTTYEIDTTFIPEVDITLNPIIQYYSETSFDEPWRGEDFEAGIDFNYSPNSDTVFNRITDPLESFEGASGLAYLTEEMELFEAWSPTFSGNTVPRNGEPIWLELEYKSTHRFAVSIFTNGTDITRQEAISFFNERATYGKIYVELGSVFSTLSGAVNYTLALGFPKPTGEIGQFYIDNVKLVQF